jgi:hypothetical protein
MAALVVSQQRVFRGGVGLLGMVATVSTMRQLVLAKNKAISKTIRLGADAAHGGEFVPKQGVGGLRLQNYLGRKLQPAKDTAYDFLDGTAKIQLKGPFLDPKTLAPVGDRLKVSACLAK